MNPLGNLTHPSRDLDRFEVGHPYANSTPSNGPVTFHGAKSRRSTHFAVLDAGGRRSPDLDGSTPQTPQAGTPAGEVGDPGRNHVLVTMQGTTTSPLLTTLPDESDSFGCGSSFRDPSLRLRRSGQHRTGDQKQQAQQGTHRHDRPLSRQRGGHPNASFSLSRGMTALSNLYSLLFGRNWWTDQQQRAVLLDDSAPWSPFAMRRIEPIRIGPADPLTRPGSISETIPQRSSAQRQRLGG